MISDPTTVLTMAEYEEGVILEDGIRVEHVTVEPVDVVAVEETLVGEEEKPQTEGEVEETVVLQVDGERLKEQAMDIQIEQVTVAEPADCDVKQDAMDRLKEEKIANV